MTSPHPEAVEPVGLGAGLVVGAMDGPMLGDGSVGVRVGEGLGSGMQPDRARISWATAVLRRTRRRDANSRTRHPYGTTIVKVSRRVQFAGSLVL